MWCDKLRELFIINLFTNEQFRLGYEVLFNHESNVKEKKID